ncbi:hypothetical protein MAR_027633 [Mya arenaria]|uniref:Myb/SANT-like DNA-binding domain-containing protein n=1 Tax=Mya arenaria TaxID=6604 RepID=A0ABY7EU27_MYAAR|nr:hypothetical protein MAR_027633 [Mya arenaria]
MNPILLNHNYVQVKFQLNPVLGNHNRLNSLVNFQLKLVVLILNSQLEIERLNRCPKAKKEHIVAQNFCKVGYTFTEGQVSGRWKTLNRVYKDVKDGRKKSGAGRKDCLFYEELDQLLGKDPDISPRPSDSENSTASSTASKTSDSKSDKDMPGESGKQNKKPVKRRKSQASHIVEFLETYVDRQEERHQKEVEERRKMHREKMGILKSLCSDLKK